MDVPGCVVVAIQRQGTCAQAPQRERFAHGRYPASQLGRLSRRHRNWKDFISLDVNMGVPVLMMILEPRVVWNHAHSRLAAAATSCSVAAPSKLQALHCQSHFLDGFHQGGASAHGVYEGSYWQLIADAEELRAMLLKLARAPAMLPMPKLVQPLPLELPGWDEFKPTLRPVPEDAACPELEIPPFRKPLLEVQRAYEAVLDWCMWTKNI